MWNSSNETTFDCTYNGAVSTAEFDVASTRQKMIINAAKTISRKNKKKPAKLNFDFKISSAGIKVTDKTTKAASFNVKSSDNFSLHQAPPKAGKKWRKVLLLMISRAGFPTDCHLLKFKTQEEVKEVLALAMDVDGQCEALQPPLQPALPVKRNSSLMNILNTTAQPGTNTAGSSKISKLLSKASPVLRSQTEEEPVQQDSSTDGAAAAAGLVAPTTPAKTATTGTAPALKGSTINTLTFNTPDANQHTPKGTFDVAAVKNRQSKLLPMYSAEGSVLDAFSSSTDEVPNSPEATLSVTSLPTSDAVKAAIIAPRTDRTASRRKEEREAVKASSPDGPATPSSVARIISTSSPAVSSPLRASKLPVPRRFQEMAEKMCEAAATAAATAAAATAATAAATASISTPSTPTKLPTLVAKSSPVATAAGKPAPPPPPAPAPATATAAPTDAAAPGTPATPRRRKLVRGGNAHKTPILPGWKDAHDAIDALDSFLDVSYTTIKAEEEQRAVAPDLDTSAKEDAEAESDGPEEATEEGEETVNHDGSLCVVARRSNSIRISRLIAMDTSESTSEDASTNNQNVTAESATINSISSTASDADTPTAPPTLANSVSDKQSEAELEIADLKASEENAAATPTTSAHKEQGSRLTEKTSSDWFAALDDALGSIAVNDATTTEQQATPALAPARVKVPAPVTAPAPASAPIVPQERGVGAGRVRSSTITVRSYSFARKGKVKPSLEVAAVEQLTATEEEPEDLEIDAGAAAVAPLPAKSFSGRFNFEFEGRQIYTASETIVEGVEWNEGICNAAVNRYPKKRKGIRRHAQQKRQNAHASKPRPNKPRAACL